MRVFAGDPALVVRFSVPVIRGGGGDEPAADVRGVQPAGNDVGGVLCLQQPGAVLPGDGLPLQLLLLLGPRRHVRRLVARQAHLPLHAPGGRGRAPQRAVLARGRRDPLRRHYLPPVLLCRIPCHGRSAAPRQGPALAGPEASRVPIPRDHALHSPAVACQDRLLHGLPARR
jgi:hypothetical protein